jgi:hypothetical protein
VQGAGGPPGSTDSWGITHSFGLAITGESVRVIPWESASPPGHRKGATSGAGMGMIPWESESPDVVMRAERRGTAGVDRFLGNHARLSIGDHPGVGLGNSLGIGIASG